MVCFPCINLDEHPSRHITQNMNFKKKITTVIFLNHPPALITRHMEHKIKSPKTDKDPQRPKKIKYKFLHYSILAGAITLSGYALNNLWQMHKFDKYVIKHIEIAANVPTAGKSSETDTGISMETALTNARTHTRIARLQNPAIIWKTPLTDISVLEKLLDKGVERSQQIEEFKQSFTHGTLKPNAPQWIRDAFQKINPRRFTQELQMRNGQYSAGGESNVTFTRRTIPK